MSRPKTNLVISALLHYLSAAVRNQAKTCARRMEGTIWLLAFGEEGPAECSQGDTISLREEEQRETFAETYARIKAGLECYETKRTSMIHKLYPGRN
jgi:hypothetical protein